MMLFRKLLRDMRIHKVQFLSIFLMSFLGLFIFSGITSEWMGLRESFNRYMEETDFADLWIIGKDFSSEDAAKVKALDGVNLVERRLIIDGTVNLQNNPTLRLNFAEKNDVSQCYTIEGEAFSPDKDGIWINTLFAEAHGLRVGDNLTLHFYGFSIKEEIKGIIMNPEYIYTIKDEKQFIPDNKSFGFAFLSKNSFPEEIAIQYNQLAVDVKSGVNIDAMSDTILKALGGSSAVAITRNAQTSYVYFDTEIKSHRSMGLLFPLVFLLISFLAIMTSMVRISANQRTQIGTLKALGFSDGKVAMHYVSYGIWVSLAGSIAGAVLGPMTIPKLVYDSLDDYFTIPIFQSRASLMIFLVAIACVAASALFSYLACRKELKDPPAQTLKPPAPKIKKLSKLELSKVWQRLGFSVHWNYRDIRRNKIRTLMGILSVSGSMMLLIGAFGMKDAIADITEQTFGEQMTYNSKIMLSDSATPEEIVKIGQDYDGQLIEEHPIEILSGDIKKVATLAVLDDGDFIRFQNNKGDFISLSRSGIALTFKMAEMLGVDVGDKISWHIYGDDNWQTVTVAQLYLSPMDQGISMSRETFVKLGYDFTATAVLSGRNIDSALKTDEIELVQSKSAIIKNLEKQMEFVNIIIAVLVAGAVVLGVVMIYNIGVISLTEKAREVSILKVLGFKTSKIRSLLQTQNIWITAAGILLGIPFGLYLINLIVNMASLSLDIKVSVRILSWFLCIAGTFTLSILVNHFLSRKVKTIDMVESLKGLE